MNVFENFVERLKQHFCVNKDVVIDFGSPIKLHGYWTCSILLPDDFLVVVAWNRHRGFMLSAGYDVPFGGAYDEIYGSPDGTFDRISALVELRAKTNFSQPVRLADLRKLVGIKQTELAKCIAMTKGGLSQIETEDDLLSMKVGTIKKLIDSLGADLVLTAQFPNGEDRIIALS